VPSVAFIFVFKMLFAIGGQELPTIGVLSALLIAEGFARFFRAFL
jgi:hypothetical protein